VGVISGKRSGLDEGKEEYGREIPEYLPDVIPLDNDGVFEYPEETDFENERDSDTPDDISDGERADDIGGVDDRDGRFEDDLAIDVDANRGCDADGDAEDRGVETTDGDIRIGLLVLGDTLELLNPICARPAILTLCPDIGSITGSGERYCGDRLPVYVTSYCGTLTPLS